MAIQKQYTMMRIYPGIGLRDKLEALQRILRREDSSLSEALRPDLERLAEKYRKVIQDELDRSN